jgi:hypothetical protein
MDQSPFEYNHPDPADALVEAERKITEGFSVAAMFGQVVGQIRAGKLAAKLAADEAELARARTLWAPVLNDGWRADADLFDVARAWAAALPWAHAEEDAFRAVGVAEDRMHQLHPYAMSLYGHELQARLEEARRQTKGGMPISPADQMLARAEAMLATVDNFVLHPQDGTPDPALRLSDFETAKFRDVLGTLGRQSARLAEAGEALDPKVAEANIRKVAPEIAGYVAEGVANANSVLPHPEPQDPGPVSVAHLDKTSALNWKSSVHHGVAATALRQSAGGRHAARRGTVQTNTRRPGLGTR